jgi:virulence-associated protein VapD
MSRQAKLRAKILSGQSDKNLALDDLRKFLVDLGFTARQGKRDHIVLSREDIYEIINLQPTTGAKAKPYQVRQVRDIVKSHGL